MSVWDVMYEIDNGVFGTMVVCTDCLSGRYRSRVVLEEVTSQWVGCDGCGRHPVG